VRFNFLFDICRIGLTKFNESGGGDQSDPVCLRLGFVVIFHSDDDFSSGMSCSKIPKRLSSLT